MKLNSKHFWYSMLGIILTIAFGGLLTWKPEILEQICRWVGGLLCGTGLVFGIVYFVKKRIDSMTLISGIICLVLGTLLCIIPSLLKFLVPILFGLWILASAGSGLYKNFISKDLHPQWWIGLLLNIVGVAIGVFVITRPVDAMETTIRLIGIAMLVHGVLRLVSIFMGRRAYTAERQDVIETTIEG